MRKARTETERRRERQRRYNEEHSIEPRSILKEIHSPLVKMSELDLYRPDVSSIEEVAEDDGGGSLAERIERLERRMKEAAKRLEFEEAAVLRDRLRELRQLQIFTA
jgi:excinuclease ABC subunit B